MKKRFIITPLLATALLACSTDKTETADQSQQTGNQETEKPAPAANTPDTEAFELAKGRVGRITIGMPVAALRNQLPPDFILTDTLLQLEGQAYPSFRIQPEGSSNSGLIVEQQCEPDCKVWRIRVRGSDFKTAAGVRVGTPFGEVLQQHRITYVSLSEAGLVAAAPEGGMSFIMDRSALSEAKTGNPQPDDIPSATPVREIFIY